MKHLYQILALFLLLAVAGGQCGFAQSDSIKIRKDTTVCENDLPLTWNGVEFETADTVEIADTDGEVIMSLTINHAYTFVLDTVICASDSLLWHDKTYKTAGTYWDSLMTADQCDSVYMLKLTVNPLPVVAILATADTICGGSVILMAQGCPDWTYLWSTNDTISLVSVDSTGSYSVTATDTNGCSNIASKTITVNPLPNVTITGDTIVCEGESTILTADGVGEGSYIWNTGVTTQNLTNVNSSGTYTVTFTDTATGCMNTATQTVVVNPVTYGDTTAVECDSFTWYGVEYNTTPETAPTHTFQNYSGCDSIVTLHLTVNHSHDTTLTATICDGENYNFLGQNIDYSVGIDTLTYTLYTSKGCDSVVTLILTVNPLPDVSISGNTSICQGQTTTLVASGGESYHWSNASTQDTISVGQSGTYMVTVTNAQLCSASASITVIVNPLPTVTISGENSFCQGDNVTLTASGASTYSWGNGDTNRSITISNAGTYTVTGTGANGCSNTAAKTVTVNPTYSIPISASICQGQSYDFFGQTLTAAGSYTDTLYTSKGCDSIIILTLTIKPLPNVTISGDTSICQGQTTTLIASGASTYVWGNASTSSSITVSHTDTYSVTGTGANGCTKTVTKMVTVNPTYNTPITESICQGQSYNFHGQILTASGIYTHTLQTSKDCDSIITLTLTVNPLPTVTISGESNFCQGDNVTLTASGANSYVWNNASHNASITVNTTDAGVFTYTVTGTDTNSCTNTATKTVTVNPTYNITVYDTICDGESYDFFGQILYVDSTYTHTLYTSKGCDSVITLILTVNPLPTVFITGASHFCQDTNTTLTASGASTYVWSNGATDFTTTVNTAGTYTVTGTDDNGCIASANKVVTVDTLPVIIITGATSFCYGSSTDLIASGAETYLWSTGAGTNSITVMDGGMYSVTGTNANGCRGAASVMTFVHPLPTPFITGDNEICSYDTTTLVAGGGEEYIWSTGESNNQIQVSETGTYYVTVTDVNGCSNTTHIVVSLAPTDTSLSDAIVTKSHDGVPYMLIYPKANLLYQWYENGVAVPDETRQYYAPNGGLQKHTCYKVLARPLDDKCGVLTKCWELTDTSTTKVRILPNPNNGQFRLLLPEGTVSVQVLNANGQTAMTRDVNGVVVVDMTTNLANGLYFVKTFRKDGIFNIEKLIINR